MLGCCPYLSRISTSSVGSLLALLMICHRDKQCLQSRRSWALTSRCCRLCGCSFLPWPRTPCRFLCAGNAYRWSKSRHRCPLWSRRCLRTEMCFCAAAKHKQQHKYYWKKWMMNEWKKWIPQVSELHTHFHLSFSKNLCRVTGNNFLWACSERVE